MSFMQLLNISQISCLKMAEEWILSSQDPAGRGTVVVTQTREYDTVNQTSEVEKILLFP